MQFSGKDLSKHVAYSERPEGAWLWEGRELLLYVCVHVAQTARLQNPAFICKLYDSLT